MASQSANKVQETKGRVKEAAGKAYRQPEAEDARKADQLKAHTQQAGADVRKAGRRVKDTLDRYRPRPGMGIARLGPCPGPQRLLVRMD